MIKTWQLIFLLFVFIPSSFSQTKDAGMINITQQDGSPSNETYCVFKDSKNYLWVATDQGVARMKGTSIQLFPDLPDNLVFKIREDKQGRIWFFSHSYKLAYFYEEKIHLFKFNDKLQSRIDPGWLLVDAFINPANEIILDTRPFSNFKINIANGDIVENKYYSDSFKNNKCILKVDQLNDSFSFAQKVASNESPFSQFVIYKIRNNDTVTYTIPCKETRFQFQGTLTFKDGNIFLFAGTTLIKLYKNGDFNVEEFKKEILCVQYDKKNDCILIGFKNGGIEKMSVKDMSIIQSNILPDNISVSSLVYDNEGGLWIATLENGIFYKKNEQITNLAQGIVYRIAKYKNDILFANSNGVFQIRNNSIIPVIERKNELIHDIAIDDYDNIIIAGRFDGMENMRPIAPVKDPSAHFGTFFLLPTASELSHKKNRGYFFRQGGVIKMLEQNSRSYKIDQMLEDTLPETGVIFNDNENNLWLGGTKLYKITNGFNSYNQIAGTSDVFAKGITCMRRMDNGVYALGVRYDGLVLMKNNKVEKIITENDGLLSNSIKYILPDSNKLWLATAKGISVNSILLL